MWFLSIAVMAADLISKRFAAKTLVKAPIILIEGVLELTYVENRGAAWGMLAGARVPFIILTVVFLAAVVLFCCKYHSELNLLSRAICALLFAGAFGNLIDRIAFGYVRDMIFVSLINFPVFNIADSAIVIGAALLVIQTLFCRDGIFDILEKHAVKKKEKNEH